MLVLSRRTGERFVIHAPGGDIWVTVVEIDRGRARVGVDAPKEWKVWREELLGRAQEPGPELGSE